MPSKSSLSRSFIFFIRLFLARLFPRCYETLCRVLRKKNFQVMSLCESTIIIWNLLTKRNRTYFPLLYFFSAIFLQREVRSIGKMEWERERESESHRRYQLHHLFFTVCKTLWTTNNQLHSQNLLYYIFFYSLFAPCCSFEGFNSLYWMCRMFCHPSICRFRFFLFCSSSFYFDAILVWSFFLCTHPYTHTR